MDDDDRRTPAVPAWTMPAVSASSPSGGGGRTRRPDVRRRSVRRAPVVACLVGAVVLLAGLGAAGPPTPVTAAEVLPPPDTSATGATGRLPDPTSPVLPLLPGLPPIAGAPLPDETPVTGSALGIPETVLAAYRAAATTVDRTAPGCGLTWPLVAGIGKVESDHAAGGAVDADGTTRRPILGPQLTGTDGNAAIADTDGGALDHDATWDRAVGPTQFIPSSWRTYGADGNGDGRADPDNVFDAGLATARYLCSSGGDLSGADARHDAVFRYNHSEAYVATVLRWADAYASGALPVPDSTGTGSGAGSDGGAGAGLGDGVLADGPVVDGTPTLAALPSPSSRAPAPSAPVITSSGATRATIEATRSPSSDLAPGAVRPAPAAAPASSGTSTSSSTSTPPRPAAAAALVPPGVPNPTSATSTSATSTTATSTSATTPASSSTPPPAKPTLSEPAAPEPAQPKPAPSTTTSPTSATTTSSTTTSSTTITPAARCTAELPAVARAFGVPAAQLTAASTAGPGTGRTTCTVRGPHGPLLVAVTAAAGAPAPATPAGISRAVTGGRTVLSVPAASVVPDDRARAALATLAAAWG